MKNAQNHRQIDARGEVEGIKLVILSILYFTSHGGGKYYWCGFEEEIRMCVHILSIFLCGFISVILMWF